MLRVVAAVLVVLVVQRVAYHAAYLSNDPFALATFSDGRLYERAAVDLFEHPPWGTQPLYLQGIYAYFMALPMGLRPGPTLSLLVQLLAVGVGLWAFHRACTSVYGTLTGGLCTVVVLAYPGLSFYENKYLTAALASVSLCAMLATLVWAARHPRAPAFVALGMATGIAVLFRGNVLLGLPAFIVAVIVLGRHYGRVRATVVAYFIGLTLSLLPMAVRNEVVTGRPTVFPAHGGGTSFYIGNNAEAKGLWNNARGLLSGDVGQERDELVNRLGIAAGSEADQAAAIGRTLYARAFEEIAEDPGRWIRLEAKKVWLMTGNDELSQDYDVRGEAELVGRIREYGLPFSVLLALGLAGVVASGLARRGRAREASGRARTDGHADEADPDVAVSEAAAPDVAVPDADAQRPIPAADTAAELAMQRAWHWTLLGMAVAVVGANVLFFTSAQHRAPLAIVLAAMAGPGLVWIVQGVRDPSASACRRLGPLALVLAIVASGASPRVRAHDNPSAAHYHNLALVQVEVGQPRAAVVTLSRALQVAPDHPVIRIERASLRRKLGMIEGASADLDALQSRSDLPAWVVTRAAEERRRVNALRGLSRRQP